MSSMRKSQQLIETRKPKTKRSRHRLSWSILAVVCTVLIVIALAVTLKHALRPAKPSNPKCDKPMSRVLSQTETAALLAARKPKPKKAWHPPHIVKVWMAVHKGRTFRVIQLPRCEHLETLVTYDPYGETLKQAKLRNNGIAACTGSFHNPKSMALADFLQRKGTIVAAARTGRSFVWIDGNGKVDISCAYCDIKRKKDVTALALGQRLVPLQRDGFSIAFMNKFTDRMAIGLNNNFIFIVQGKSDIWRLSHFMSKKLPVTSAVNCDGGHVVRGKGPVHLVFRWKTAAPPKTPTCLMPAHNRKGGA